MTSEKISCAELLASRPVMERRRFANSLSGEAARAIKYDWSFWGRPAQFAPLGDWFTWLILTGRGWGKALDINTKIPTVAGWSTMAAVQAGDTIFDEKGRPTTITYTSPIYLGEKCYRIVFDDGSEIVADAQHEWSVLTKLGRKRKKALELVTTEQMIPNLLYLDREANYAIPVCGALDLPNAALPIDPYILGLWLGDGDSSGAAIALNDKDFSELRMEFEKLGLKLGTGWRKDDAKCATYYVSNGLTGQDCFATKLKALGVVKNKHIPQRYLRASFTQRLALLQGLLDADGYAEYGNNRIEISSTREKLAFEIFELMISLGLKASIVKKATFGFGKAYEPHYRIRCSTRADFDLFRLSRHSSRRQQRSGAAQSIRSKLRYIKAIEPIESVPVRCIQVDSPNSLFLVSENMIPTHNTRTGAEWVRRLVEREGVRRIALIGATAADVRDTMIEGESGILAVCPPTFRPVYEPSKRRVLWPNGAAAYMYSAEEPDRLRGPQHEAAWEDELASWKYPGAHDMLLFGLRLGVRPRTIITTTPKPIPILKKIINDPSTVTVRGSTFENIRNLAPAFVSYIRDKYEGTRLGAQELHAELLEDVEGALWSREILENNRVVKHPALKKIIVAVDPAATSHTGSADTGIIVLGLGVDGLVYVIDDQSIHDTPDRWGKAVVAAFHLHKANKVLVETNQGGEMVSLVLKTVDPYLPIKTIHASRGKFTRAEPVAALYEQGKVKHVGFFAALEDQLCSWVPGETSPDRLDALVHGVSELALSNTPHVRVRKI